MMSDEFQDEHEYYGYWRARINSQTKVSHADLQDMMSSRYWRYPLGEIVWLLSSGNKLSQEDLNWLLEQLPPDSYAYRQGLARKILNDPELNWERKLEYLLHPHTMWAVRLAIEAIPAEHLGKAWEMVAISRLSKARRMRLLTILSKRAVST